jgi:hypothetical protein
MGYIWTNAGISMVQRPKPSETHLHIPGRHRLGLLEEAIGQGALPVIDVRDDGKVPHALNVILPSRLCACMRPLAHDCSSEPPVPVLALPWPPKPRIGTRVQ